MGAAEVSRAFDGGLDSQQLREKYKSQVEQDEYENGHGAYSGTLPYQLTITNETFDTQEEGWDWLEEHVRKGDGALAVKSLESNLWLVAAEVAT